MKLREEFRKRDPNNDVIATIMKRDPNKDVIETIMERDPNKDVIATIMERDPNKDVIETFMKRDPNKDVIATIMELTLYDRRQAILNQNEGVREILEKYPCLLNSQICKVALNS